MQRWNLLRDGPLPGQRWVFLCTVAIDGPVCFDQTRTPLPLSCSLGPPPSLSLSPLRADRSQARIITPSSTFRRYQPRLAQPSSSTTSGSPPQPPPPFCQHLYISSRGGLDPLHCSAFPRSHRPRSCLALRWTPARALPRPYCGFLASTPQALFPIRSKCFDFVADFVVVTLQYRLAGLWPQGRLPHEPVSILSPQPAVSP